MTIALFWPRPFATCVPQLLSHVTRPLFNMTVAAWHSVRLRFTSPALAMPPETSRSPDWLRDGVKPTQGPTFFEEVKRAGSSTVDRRLIGQSDNCANLWHCHQPNADRIILRHLPNQFSRYDSSSRSDALARNIGVVAVSSMAMASESSRMRSLNLPWEIAPTFRPKFRKSPRSDTSIASMFSWIALRALRMARTSCG